SASPFGAEPLVADDTWPSVSDGALEPFVASAAAPRIAPMSVALLALADVLSSIAWAIVWSSSRSLDSRRHRSNWGPGVIRFLSLTSEKLTCLPREHIRALRTRLDPPLQGGCP